MSNENTSEILLKITSDLTGIKEMQAGFSSLFKTTTDAANAVATMGARLEASLAQLGNGAKSVGSAVAEVGEKTSEAMAKSGKETENSTGLFGGLGAKLNEISVGGVAVAGLAFQQLNLMVLDVVGSFKQAVTGTTALSQRIHDLELNTGVTAEAAQVLAGAIDVSIETLSTKSMRLSVMIGSALTDTKGQAADMLKELKLDPAALNAEPFEAQLKMIADSMAHLTTRSEKMHYVTAMFGRGAGEMIPLLERLHSEGFEKLSESVAKSDGVLTKFQANEIWKTNDRSADATNKLAVSFHDLNLRILERHAEIAEWMAEHSRLIRQLAEVAAATAIAFTAMKAAMLVQGATFWTILGGAWIGVPWASIGTRIMAMLGGPLVAGVALVAAALAGIIVVWRDSALEAIDKLDGRLAEMSGKHAALIREMKKATTAENIDKQIADAKKQADELKTRIDELKAIEAKKGWHFNDKTAVMERGSGLNDDQKAELKNAEENYGMTMRLLSDQNIAKQKAAAVERGIAAEKAQRDKAALESAKEITAELVKQKDAYAKQEQSAIYAASTEEKKLRLLFDEGMAVGEQYKKDVEAAELDNQNADAKVAALAKANVAMLDIRQRQHAAEKALADAQKQANEAKEKALKAEEDAVKKTAAVKFKLLAEELDAQKAILETRRQAIEGELADLESQYWRTDAEKWQEKKRLQDALLAVSKEHLKTVTAIRDVNAKDPASTDAGKKLSERAVSDAGMTVREDEKTVASAGPDPRNIGAVLSKSFADLRSGFATVSSSISGMMGGAIGGMQRGIEGLINRTMTWGQAARSVLSSIGSSAVQSFASMVTGWVFSKTRMDAISKLFAAKEVATTAATTAATTGIHAGGETAKTGSTLLGSIARGVIRVGESIWHGIQVAFRVATHVAGEAAMTAGTLVGTLLRIPMTIAESIAKVFSAGVGALSALSAIPIVGPILGIAAMAGVIAAGLAVVGKIGKGFADGGYTGDGRYGEYAGPAHKGEVVFSQKDVARNGGVAAVERMRLSGGPMSTGGGAGLSGKSGLAGVGHAVAGGKTPAVNQAFFNSHQSAENWLKSQSGRRVMTDFIRQASSEM